VDLLDVADFMSGGLFDNGPYATPGLAMDGVTTVPEPAIPRSFAVLVATGLGLRVRPKS
jgi:hypothetical protein